MKYIEPGPYADPEKAARRFAIDRGWMHESGTYARLTAAGSQVRV
ncbi:hypothetical protein [Bradyrhizobium sp. Leo121]|nr:hypothetical protein [Bradyrhizobium sp. Leo121]